MTQIRVENLTKRYGETVALSSVDLEIGSGELFFLLGPSGCGKTTLLRLIAGLQAPSSGRILFDGRDVTSVPTQKRNAVMCFQGYALWPHMTVRENIRFGLSVRETPSDRESQQAEVASRRRVNGTVVSCRACLRWATMSMPCHMSWRYRPSGTACCSRG